MTELIIQKSSDPGDWNRQLRHLRGNVFHSSEWAEYVEAEQPGCSSEFYTFVDTDGSVIGVALGFRAASTRRVVAPFTGRLWLDAMPAMAEASNSLQAIFLRQISLHARAAGAITLDIGSYDSPTRGVLSSGDFSVSKRIEFELDLTQPESAIWNRIDVKRRQRVRKAKKEGVEIRQLSPRDGVTILRRLQEASFERVEARGGPRLDDRDYRSGDPILKLTDAGSARIIGGFVSGECVTASLFTTFNGRAYHALSGHNRRALETQAPSLLLYETMLRLAEEGYTRLNLGGCTIDALNESSPEHGVYCYKKAFGGEQLNCESGHRVLRPTIRRIALLWRNVAL